MNKTSAASLAPQLAVGALSARELVDACLDRIAAREPKVRAFASIDPEYARRQADALDAHRKAGRPLGPMHGIPVALKDIVDTADYPTENGTVLDAGRRPSQDATLVSRLRAAGAVIIGKTVTTELAYKHPGPTRNPHNLAHTPGGSSQGSAAAVADGMVPIAVGSQTVGSTIRPASFCGVVGFKPSHGAIPLTGVLKTAERLDTAGIFAADLEDVALAASVMQGYDPADPRTRPAPHADLLKAARQDPALPPSFVVIGGPFWEEASPDVHALFTEITERFADNVDGLGLPEIFDNAYPAHIRLMNASFARNLRHYRERGEQALSAPMLEALDEGVEVSAVDYLAACDWQLTLREGLDRIFERYDAILTPAAPGEAPAGFMTTGDSRFNALWTFVGAPAVSLPVGAGSNGLPIGLQLVGRYGEDGRLLRAARWLSRILAEQ